MQTKDPPRIVAGEKMGDAIFIEFDDGSSGLFSAPLLYAMLPQATAVISSDPLENGEEEE